TAPAHRASGQNLASELRKRGYPRFPQPLLLLPTRESWESVSKRGLCTTRCPGLQCHSARLDPEGHRLSVRCVRLVPGVLPLTRRSDTGTTKASRARAPATDGGGNGEDPGGTRRTRGGSGLGG